MSSGFTKEIDFPIDSIRCLEEKIAKIRILLIGTAENIAKSDSACTVTRAHINRALITFLHECRDNPELVLRHLD